MPTDCCKSPCILGVLLALAKPLGWYMARVYEGKLPAFVRWMAPARKSFLPPVRRGQQDEEMRWTHYALAMLWFSLLGVLAVYGVQRLQGMLPLNPQDFGAVSPDSSFNTALELRHQHQLAGLRAAKPP